MGSKVVHASGYLSGLMVPWPCSPTLAADHALGTDYSEADPEFGPAAYTGSARLRLEASGTPASGMTSLEVRTVRGGMPDGAAGGVLARVNGSGDWYGRDRVSQSTGYQEISSSSGRGHTLVRLADDTVVMVYGVDTGSSIAYRSVTRDPDTGQWDTIASTIATTSQGSLTLPVCAACIGPDGAILAYVLVSEDGVWFQVDVYRSADGSTWTLQRRNADPVGAVWDPSSTVTPAPVRLRAASVGGSVLLLATTFLAAVPYYYVEQWYSSDGGFTLQGVGARVGGSTGNRFADDLTTVQGAYLAVITSGSGGEVRAHVTGSPQEQVMAQTGALVTNAGTTLAGSVAAWDGVGYPYVFVQDGLVPYFSRDGGSTWAAAQFGYGLVSPSGAAGLGAHSAVAVRGQIVIASNKWDGSAITGGVHETRWGGVTNRNLGYDIRSWRRAYVPVQSLNAAGWTTSDTGAPARSLSATTGQNIVCGAGDDAGNYYDVTLTTTGVTGYFYVCARVNSTSNLSYGVQFAFRVPGSAIHVELNGTQIRAHDSGGSSTYVSHGFAAGSFVEILAVVDNANTRAYVYYRELVHDQPGHLRTWTAWPAITGLSSVGNDVRHRVNVGSSSDVDILACGQNYRTGGSDLSNGVDATELYPIPLSAAAASWAVGGASLRAIGGPALASSTETYSIPVSSPYPKAATLPGYRPSPRSPWRSASSPGDVSLRYTLDPETGAGVYQSGDVVAIYLGGLVGAHQITVRDGSTSIQTVDLRTALSFQRTGSSLRPSSAGGAASGRWIEEGELVGGAVDLGSGDIRRIAANTAGSLASGSTIAERRCTITLEDVDSGDATSGTCYIHPPRALLLWYLRGQSTVTQLRLDIASGATVGPGGYREIGTVAAGWVRVLGRGWDRTTPDILDTGAEVTDLPDRGQAVARRGPSRRSVEVAIVDTAIDLTQIQRSAASPDYVVVSSHASAAPAAERWADPRLVRGLYDQYAGEPIVYLPRIPIESGSGDAITAHTIGWAAGALYGRITSAAVRNEWAGVGSAGATEMVRLPTLTITEVV